MFLRNILDFFFGKGRQEAENDMTGNDAATIGSKEDGSKDVAPGTTIPYDDTLVGRLKKDHRDLIQLYLSIEALFKQGDLLHTVEALGDLRNALQGHLLTENVRLYIYLEHVFSNDQQSHDLIHDFRYEMDGIGKVAMGFLNKYKDLSSQASLVSTFAADFAEIGKVLTQRIEREESMLYPLYMPPAQAAHKRIG